MSDVFEQILEQKWTFFMVFFMVFSAIYIVLLALDFYPEPRTSIAAEEASQNVVVATSSQQEQDNPIAMVTEETAEPMIGEPDIVQDIVETTPPSAVSLPVKIAIPKLDREVTVLNPASRAIADLDAALLSGVVRHPDSAHLEQEGNLFILGHSSYLPSVFNKNFQAFNGIEDLSWGDTIIVYSDTHIYEYRVEEVYQARAQDVTVPIAGSGNLLTLATCNSFGSVDDRFIVEAKRVSKQLL